jgi:hypothetical protein
MERPANIESPHSMLRVTEAQVPRPTGKNYLPHGKNSQSLRSYPITYLENLSWKGHSGDIVHT